MTPDAPDIRPPDLEGYAEVAQILGNRPLYHFSRVHSFFFGEREDFLGDTWHDIDLVLAELEPPRRKIGFRFHCVTDVTYSGFGQIMGLYVQSIEERGWEKLRYEVGDYEDGHIHLFCHSVALYDPRKVAEPGGPVNDPPASPPDHH